MCTNILRHYVGGVGLAIVTSLGGGLGHVGPVVGREHCVAVVAEVWA